MKNMSLTKQDLQTLQGMFVDHEVRIIKRIDKLDDTLNLQMAAGLEEVHTKVDTVKVELTNVKDTVERIERVQQAEVTRVDDHGQVLTRLKRKVKLL